MAVKDALLNWWRQYFQTRHPQTRKQWFLLAGFCDANELAKPPIERLNPIYPPDDMFWADPFVYRRQGRNYIFCEEYPYATKIGRISVMEVDGQANLIGKSIPVIEEPYHLSYPYLFEYDGELYMVPEKKKTRRVDIYRCIEFPLRWQQIGTLLSGRRIVDSTLFEHQGRWWLFCAVKENGLRYDETLYAFHADNPMSSKWIQHPQNPLVRDFSGGRPAGRILRDNQGRLLRPSQNCVRHYGDGLNINEITLLTPEAYQERRLWYGSGEEIGGWHGMHHLDWQHGLLVMDAQRLLVP